jgi:hypothetical protein
METWKDDYAASQKHPGARHRQALLSPPVPRVRDALEQCIESMIQPGTFSVPNSPALATLTGTQGIWDVGVVLSSLGEDAWLRIRPASRLLGYEPPNLLCRNPHFSHVCHPGFRSARTQTIQAPSFYGPYVCYKFPSSVILQVLMFARTVLPVP